MKKLFLIICLLFFQCNFYVDAEKNLIPLLKFFSFRNSENTELRVLTMFPRDKSTGIYLNTRIFVIFNMVISGNSSNFFLEKEDKSIIAGTLEFSDNILIFTPAQNLPPNASLFINIKSNERVMPETQYKFSTGFEIDTVAPIVINTVPLSEQINVALNQEVSVTMSEEIDPTTAKPTLFTIIDMPAIFNFQNVTLSLKPIENFPNEKPVIVLLREGIKDMAGNRINSRYAWIFTTGSSTLPNDSNSVECKYDFGIFSACVFN